MLFDKSFCVYVLWKKSSAFRDSLFFSHKLIYKKLNHLSIVLLKFDQ